MSAEKYSASMDTALLSEARSAAEAQGITLSAWIAEAAANRLRLAALRELVDDWEVEHGTITTAELDALDQKVADARRRATARATDQDAVKQAVAKARTRRAATPGRRRAAS